MINRRTMQPHIELAPGADENGLANMLSGLVRQNLEAKPRKLADFDAALGRVACIAIVADDIDVALTMRFRPGKLTIYDGIDGIPQVTIRGPSEAILAMSNMPLKRPPPRPPHPRPSRPRGSEDHAHRPRHVHCCRASSTCHGMAFHGPLLMRLTRIMSING